MLLTKNPDRFTLVRVFTSHSYISYTVHKATRAGRHLASVAALHHDPASHHHHHTPTRACAHTRIALPYPAVEQADNPPFNHVTCARPRTRKENSRNNRRERNKESSRRNDRWVKVKAIGSDRSNP